MKKKITLGIALLLLSFTALFATNYTVNFGSFFYSPDTLMMVVGDNVTWSGSFPSHPLQSTSVPVGANSFSCNTGTSFSYTVVVPGTYNYECSVHGFKGVLIVAAATGISSSALSADIKIAPNPAGSFFTVSVPENLIGELLTITDVTGRIVTAVQLSAVNRQLSTENFFNGIYFVTIGNRTQKLIVQQ